MDRLRKRYSHLVGGSFLVGKAAWALSRCLTTESADYCMLVSEWVWFKVTSLLAKAGSELVFSFGVRACTEMEIRCIKGMYRLKLVSGGKNSGIKGLLSL